MFIGMIGLSAAMLVFGYGMADEHWALRESLGMIEYGKF